MTRERMKANSLKMIVVVVAAAVVVVAVVVVEYSFLESNYC